MAFIGMSMGLCPPIATLVGGQLHVTYGWRANFVLMSVMAAVLLVACWRAIPAQRPQAPARGWVELLAGYRRLLGEPEFLLYVTIVASTTTTFYTFLGGAPIVLKGYGVTPERVGWYIMCIPLAYMAGNLWTSRLVRRTGDQAIMWMGQGFNVASLVLLLALGLGGADTPLALALPLMLLGIGHGLLAPPTLAGTVGLVPALAGSAAAVAGLMQQTMGAVGGYVVGLVRHDNQVNLALIMLAWTAAGLIAQVFLRRTVRKRRAATT
jgi:MFS transporter, DHA1 family, multidrug resistance protein